MNGPGLPKRLPGLVAAGFAASMLAGCGNDPGTRFPGATEWDRAAVLAEASEPVVEWLVAEGDTVAAGQPLLALDSRRFEARIAEAEARLAEAEARLEELRSGPRPQTIERARAELRSAEAAEIEAELEYERVASLLERGLTAQASVDQALAARDQRRAAVAAASAVLAELLAGTRAEQLAQAEARLATIRAELTGQRLTRDRLSVVAPRAGKVDTLPFRPGDQPAAGNVVASLLVGELPIARIFVPASHRADIAIGDRFEIAVEGVAEPFAATLRSIRGEASFTPYYALTGDDASRLVYRAELVFEDARAASLPAGLPLVAIPRTSAAGDE